MEKTIHVNAYTRNDGTEVREHYRNINTRETFLPEQKEGPGPLDPILIPEGQHGPVMNLEGDPVISGSVVLNDVRLPQGSGDVLEAIATVAIGLGMTAANMAYQMYIKPALVETLQPQLNNAISNIKATQVQVEKLSNKYLDKLVNTKNQQEYEHLLKGYTEQKALNQKLNESIAKIDYANSKSDYKTIAEELKNYQSNFDEVMKKTSNNSPIMTQNQQNNILANTMLPSSPNILANTVNRLASTPIKNKMIVDSGMAFYNLKNNIPDAKELWKASSHDFSQSKEYIEKNGNLVSSVSKLPSQKLQQIVTQKLQQQLGAPDALGVIFQPDSSLSQAISNSVEMKEFFQKNAEKLLNGQIIEQSSTNFISDSNLHNALGHADILYSYIDQNGNLCSIVFDTYDFNPNDPDWKVQLARLTQEAKIIRNYYTLSLVIIPKGKWLIWL